MVFVDGILECIFEFGNFKFLFCWPTYCFVCWWFHLSCFIIKVFKCDFLLVNRDCIAPTYAMTIKNGLYHTTDDKKSQQIIKSWWQYFILMVIKAIFLSNLYHQLLFTMVTWSKIRLLLNQTKYFIKFLSIGELNYVLCWITFDDLLDNQIDVTNIHDVSKIIY